MLQRIWTISNLLSFSRVVLLAPLGYVLFSDSPNRQVWMAAIIVLAGLTDFFDGYLARKLHQVTDLGKIVDPLADKITAAGAAILFVMVGLLPLWYLIVVVARDLLILVGGIYIKAEEEYRDAIKLAREIRSVLYCARHVAVRARFPFPGRTQTIHDLAQHSHDGHFVHHLRPKAVRRPAVGQKERCVMVFGNALKKLKDGLTKTRETIFTKVATLVSTRSIIDEEMLERLEEILISGDVGVGTTMLILENIKKRVRQEKIESSSQLSSLLKDEIARVLHVDGTEVRETLDLPTSPRPYVVMIVGVNGVGKTTTIGKLAFHYKEKGYKVIVGAADTFRAAANEQLEIWAQRAGVDIIQQKHGADPAAVAFDSLNSALARSVDVVIIDTAGRLHTKTNLMEELKKIHRVLGKRLPGAPNEVLLVLDATTGQNALQQVKQFTAAVEITGLVLTKLDGTAKGGIVLAISNELKIPVKFIGVGEQIDDLQAFDRKAFVDALFDGFQPSN